MHTISDPIVGADTATDLVTKRLKPVVFAIATCVAAAACAPGASDVTAVPMPPSVPSDQVEVTPGNRGPLSVPDAPTGFQTIAVDGVPGTMIETLTTSETTTPLSVVTALFVPQGADVAALVDPGASTAITLTMTSYATYSGALSTYNGWFARYGFPAAAERRSLGFGDASERYDLEWPPLHAVIARQGTRFALVVGDGSIPEPERSAAMEMLARAGIGVEPEGPRADGDTEDAPSAAPDSTPNAP